MKYNGGKARICKQVADTINSLSRGRDKYMEPFTGAAWVTQHVTQPTREAYDINPYLISMWKALQYGWKPPTDISENEYQIAKLGAVSDHERAFIGFGCSWGGKWFGGYARGKAGRNYCKEAHDSLLRKIELLDGVEFIHSKYQDLSPSNAIIYCDPPYPDTTEGWMPDAPFDHDEFWDTMRGWAIDNTILVSNWDAPSDIMCIADWSDVKVVSGSHPKDPEKKARTEKLFVLGL